MVLYLGFTSNTLYQRKIYQTFILNHRKLSPPSLYFVSDMYDAVAPCSIHFWA